QVERTDHMVCHPAQDAILRLRAVNPYTLLHASRHAVHGSILTMAGMRKLRRSRIRASPVLGKVNPRIGSRVRSLVRLHLAHPKIRSSSAQKDLEKNRARRSDERATLS